MYSSITKHLRAVLSSAATCALILSASLSYADDTEIFFGGPSIADGVHPNVLFILDNSGSMAWRTTSNTNPSGSEKSRLQILKESFANIISNAGAINAGIMVLNSRSEYNNTRMVYPVSYIDDPLPSSVTLVASTPQITVSGDDATESSLGGGLVINSSTLQMGYVSGATTTLNNPSSVLVGNDGFFQSAFGGQNWACRMNEPGGAHNANGDACGNNDRSALNMRSNNDTNAGDTDPIRGTALLQFSGFNVPAAAGLAADFKAYLDLRPVNNQSFANRPTVNVTLQNSKTPAALNDLSQVDPGRTYFANSAIQSTSWTTGNTSTLEITNLVKQLLATNANALQAIFLKIRATTANDYTFCMRNCGSSNGVSLAPTLRIEYSSTAAFNETKKAALRFQNVGIPQGATVTSAHIDFAPAVTDNGAPLTLQVRAEKVADAALFSAGASIAGRTPKTTALTSWSPMGWTNVSPPVHAQGPNVTTLVQEVVNQTSWCGNNAMAFYFEPSTGTGTRTTYSIDGSPGLQPTLTVEYTGGNSGCLNPIIEASVTTPKDDAYEQNDDTMRLGDSTLPVSRSRFAARYPGISLINGATILDTQVVLTPANTVNSVSAGSPVTTTVRFENSGNAAPITNTNDNITDRSDTADSSCTISNWVTGVPVICAGSQLKTGLQSIVNRGDWAPGNALLVMSVQGADSNLEVQAYESNPAQTIKLRIKVASGGLASSTYTVRQHLNALVQTMTSGNGTPIVPTYLEAAKYLRGERAGYSSPITSACQPTHIVLLTDGQANGNDNTTRSTIATQAGSCSVPLVSTGDDPGIADTASTSSDEQCGRKLAEWLALTDQSSLSGDSFINTHTIGFALGALAPSTVAQTYLSDLADNGNGGAYTASNATELSQAFSDILQSVQDVDTTFVSASAPVNSFERENNKDELYFSLFSPRESHKWPGNLKRYRFEFFNSDGTLNPRIVDADGVNAVDPVTGNFFGTARSYWSTTDDGNDSTAGGAAKQLSAPASRKLYTHIGASPSAGSPATLASQLLADSNATITNAMLNATNDTERATLFSYIRGLNPTTALERKELGDPIHSSPRLATYSCVTPNPNDSSKCDLDDQTAFIGTNEGFVQAFNTTTGKELFGFMPGELLGNIKKLKENPQTNSATNPRPYGMDNPVTLWINDVNKDGKILDNPSDTTPQTGEFIYAYATMGRGGRSLYALDVTNRSSPKLLWYIKGGVTPGFNKLGQTWSQPVKTKIKIGSTITDVLIFAGGYDANQDEITERTSDSYGNAIYVVNAKTGSLIWSASNEATNASAAGHKQLTKMLYSMPGKARVIDLQTNASGQLAIDQENLADQIFIGDVGGQVWRFFINNGSTGASLITPAGTSGDGVFATAIPSNYTSLDLAGKRANLRRFYNEPDVALLNANGKHTLSVNIGSGYRGHPLNDYAEDKFYSFRTSNLVDPNGGEGTLNESALLDITSILVPNASQSVLLDLSDNRKQGGWYINLAGNNGEKVLTRALTVGKNNIVFFSTYQPAAGNASTNTCEAAFGTARGYAVSLLDGSPAYIDDPANPKLSDRVKVLSVPGIPPNPEIICIGANCAVVSGPGNVDSVETLQPGKLYWIDKTTLD